jgi:hypothetical protein
VVFVFNWNAIHTYIIDSKIRKSKRKFRKIRLHSHQRNVIKDHSYGCSVTHDLLPVWTRRPRIYFYGSLQREFDK